MMNRSHCRDAPRGANMSTEVDDLVHSCMLACGILLPMPRFSTWLVGSLTEQKVPMAIHHDHGHPKAEKIPKLGVLSDTYFHPT